MKTIKPFLDTTLFVRAFMLTIILITGGGNFAWADTVLKTIDFSDPEWSDVTFTQGASDAPETINGVTFNAKSGTYHFSISDGVLTFPNKDLNSGNYALGFPVTGIVGGVITIKVYNGTSSANVKYKVKSGGTSFNTSDCGSGSSLTSSGFTPFTIIETGLSDTKAYVYIGRYSTFTTITKIEVLTPAFTVLSESSFYQLYKQSASESVSSLITAANLPSYVNMNVYTPDNSSENSSSITTPHNFSELSSSKYYRLKPSKTSTIVVGALSNVKSIRLYGNGSAKTGTININATKLSGDGSDLAAISLDYENSQQTVNEFTTGDLSNDPNYNPNTYYLYTISFSPSGSEYSTNFSLWGIYIEKGADISCPVPTSLFYSSVTYNSATISWSSSADAWQIAYSKNETEQPDTLDSFDDDVTTNSYDLSALDDYTTYHVYVRTDCGGGDCSDWEHTSFTTLQQYPKPTAFALTDKTGTTASFSWTYGDDEDAWQIAYSTDEDFNPNSEGTMQDVDKRPYELTGLTTGTTYYAYIRADYGSSNYSRWSNKLTFVPTNDFSVNEGVVINSRVPIDGNNTGSNDLTKSQFIIPATSLSDKQKGQITHLKFHSSNSSISWGVAKFDIYMKETSDATFSSDNIVGWGTCVASNKSLSVTDNVMTIELDRPFNYKNNNLMIGFKQTVKGSYSYLDWVGVTSTNSGVYGTTSYKRINQSPKVTITEIPITNAYVKIGATGFTTFASWKPLDLSRMPSGLTAYVAASDAVDGNIVHLTQIETAVPAETGLILKGTANATYAIPVAESGSAPESNLLVGVTPLETTLAVNATSGKDNYVLVNNGGTPEFQSLVDNGATIPGGKAYLQVGDYSAGARTLRIAFDEEGAITGIVNNYRETISPQRYYNLQGQRITKPLKGIYIVDGKRKIMK